MRKFSVTVNGTVYEVEVEEIGAGVSAPVVAPAPVAAPKAAAAPVEEEKPVKKAKKAKKTDVADVVATEVSENATATEEGAAVIEEVVATEIAPEKKDEA